MNRLAWGLMGGGVGWRLKKARGRKIADGDKASEALFPIICLLEFYDQSSAMPIRIKLDSSGPCSDFVNVLFGYRVFVLS